MAIIVNDRDVLLQSVTPRVQQVGLPPNVAIDPSNIAGLQATFDAVKQVELSATSQVFVVPKVGAIQPASIEITALLKTITGTPTFTLLSGTASFTTAGNKITILPSNMTSPTATIEVSVLFNSILYKDVITIGKIAEGSDGVVGLLSNEACTVAASDTGVVTGAALASAGGTFNVFDGIINKTGLTSVAYSVFSQTGCTISIAPTGIYTVSAITANTGSAVLRAVYTRGADSITIDKVYSVSKAIAGIIGYSAKLLYLAATSQVFQIPKTGSVTPATITLTATAQNLDAGAGYVWTTTPTMTLGGTGNVRTLAYTDMTSDTVKVEVLRDGLTDTITLVKIREGIDGAAGVNAVSGFLTNESASVATDAAGNGAVYTGTGGFFKVYNGTTDVTASATFSVVGTPTGITASISTLADATRGEYTLSNMTVDQTTVTFQASSGGVVIQKIYSITKSRAGSAGTSKAVTVSTDSQIFKIDKTGTVDRSQVTINASGQNVTGSPVFSATGGATLTGTGNSRVLAYSNMPVDSVTVTVVWDSVTDSVTIVKVREGINSIQGFLTNEATLVPADKNGTVSGGSFAVAGGTFKMFDGITEKTGAGNVAYSVFSESGVDIDLAATGVYTVLSMSADSGTAVMRAVYSGVSPSVTIEKVFTIAKSRTGADGATGGVGATGNTGPRGTVNISVSTTGTSWSDSAANTALATAGYGAPQSRDIVTLYNTGSAYSESRFYNGSAWITLDAYINGNLLVTGTVAAAALAAGSVQTQHLSVGTGGKNILQNSMPGSGSTLGWANSGNNTGQAYVTATPRNIGGYAPVGVDAVVNNMTGAPADNTVFGLQNDNFGKKYPVKPGQRYEVSAYVQGHRSKDVHVRIFWYKADGVTPTTAQGYAESAGSFVNYQSSAYADSLATHPRSTGFVVAPSDAFVMMFGIRASGTGQVDPYIMASLCYFGEATANQTTFSQWSDGGSTKIDGGVISANTINGDRVIANTIQGDRVVTGSLNANKIVANTITTDRIIIGQVSQNISTAYAEEYFGGSGEVIVVGKGFSSTGGNLHASFNGCYRALSNGPVHVYLQITVKHPNGVFTNQVAWREFDLETANGAFGFHLARMPESAANWAGYYEFWVRAYCYAGGYIQGDWTIMEMKV